MKTSGDDVGDTYQASPHSVDTFFCNFDPRQHP